MSTTKKIRFIQLVDEAFEDLELWYPVYRLREAGIEVLLAGKEANRVYHGKYGVPATTDLRLADVNPEDFDGLLIPGGWAPDKLRRYPEVLDLARHMDQENKIIGQICHAGWVLVSANTLKGKQVTSTPAIRDDLVNAGAHWIDEPVVTHGSLVSAKGPADLPQYMRALLSLMALC
ncbi:type 1 glutamine amidotransferase domain-containing protein [Anoxynatronum sibiricum]|uniref:Type 1 glutamine amidotransferase domain-containing protein n=1 Tax=Anoxynatronum sibiricum TaxID=210623 RepID=A0ABU9VZS1_9CLOT